MKMNGTTPSAKLIRPSSEQPQVTPVRVNIGPRNQRQHSRAGATAAADGRHRTGREGLVRVGQVVQQRHEEQVEAHAETQACRHGHRPVDLWAGRPTQPEERGDAQRPADAGERQAAVFFDGDPGRLARLRAAEEEVVGEEDAAAKKNTEGDCAVSAKRSGHPYLGKRRTWEVG